MLTPDVKFPPFAVPLIITVSPTFGDEGDTETVIDGLLISVEALVSAAIGITSSNPAITRIQMRNKWLGIFIINMGRSGQKALFFEISPGNPVDSTRGIRQCIIR